MIYLLLLGLAMVATGGIYLVSRVARYRVLYKTERIIYINNAWAEAKVVTIGWPMQFTLQQEQHLLGELYDELDPPVFEEI